MKTKNKNYNYNYNIKQQFIQRSLEKYNKNRNFYFLLFFYLLIAVKVEAGRGIRWQGEIIFVPRRKTKSKSADKLSYADAVGLIVFY